MLSVRKILLIGMLLPFTVSPVKADESPAVKFKSPTDFLIAGSSVLFFGYVSLLLLKKSGPVLEKKANEVADAIAPKPKTEKGQDFRKAAIKFAQALVGTAGSIAIATYVQKPICEQCPLLKKFI